MTVESKVKNGSTEATFTPVDCRDEMVRKVRNMLVDDFQADDIKKILHILVVCLDGYEVTNRCTDIMVVQDTTEQLLKYYAASLLTEGKSKNTVRTYLYALRNFYKDLNKEIIEATTMDCRIYLAKRQSKVSLSTIDNERHALSSFYMWCVKDGILEKNPVANISAIKFPDKIENKFEDVEVDELQKKCKDVRERAIVELLLATGLRADELLSLNRDDVLWEKKQIIVKDGKGSKSRVVFFNQMARKYLAQYLESRKDSNVWLFQSRNSKRLSYNSLGDLIRNLGERAGVTNTHCHRFRKTFATRCYERGMSIRDIQLLLGHENLDTTQRYLCNGLEHAQIQYALYA